MVVAIVGYIREIETLCTVHRRRVQVPARRQDDAGMLTSEIPDDLAWEAVQRTSTQDEAERYVLDNADEIKLVWPEWVDDTELSGSSPTVK
jgi:hypothetical protein